MSPKLGTTKDECINITRTIICPTIFTAEDRGSLPIDINWQRRWRVDTWSVRMVTSLFIDIVAVSPVRILRASYNVLADLPKPANAISIKAPFSTYYLPSVVQRPDLRLSLLLQLFSCFPQP